MKLWTLDIEKFYNGESWVNRYILFADTLDAAQVEAETVYGYERAIHITNVTMVRYRLADTVIFNDVFRVVNKGQPGLRTVASGALPLFNVVRIDFGAANGRPSRKYLRLPLCEEDVNGSSIEAAVVTLLTNSYATPLVNLASFVDVDGEALISHRIFPNIAMRQLRRRKKKKVTPAP